MLTEVRYTTCVHRGKLSVHTYVHVIVCKKKVPSEPSSKKAKSYRHLRFKDRYIVWFPKTDICTVLRISGWRRATSNSKQAAGGASVKKRASRRGGWSVGRPAQQGKGKGKGKGISYAMQAAAYIHTHRQRMTGYIGVHAEACTLLDLLGS